MVFLIKNTCNKAHPQVHETPRFIHSIEKTRLLSRRPPRALQAMPPSPPLGSSTHKGFKSKLCTFTVLKARDHKREKRIRRNGHPFEVC